MQLYVTDRLPSAAAQSLDDRRLRSSIVDCAIMLAAALERHGRLPPFPTTHRNHPITRWTGNSANNYGWVLDHFKAATDQHLTRFNSRHAMDQFRDHFENGWFMLPQKGLEPFINQAYSEKHNVDFRDLEVPYSYRNYLRHRWFHCKPVWTNCAPPTWRAS